MKQIHRPVSFYSGKVAAQQGFNAGTLPQLEPASGSSLFQIFAQRQAPVIFFWAPAPSIKRFFLAQP